jgi:hypothetical protein
MKRREFDDGNGRRLSVSTCDIDGVRYIVLGMDKMGAWMKPRKVRTLIRALEAGLKP